MYKGSKLVFLVVTVLLLSVVELECRRTSGGTGRRGSSRGKNYGSNSQSAAGQGQGQGGYFSSWFGGGSSAKAAGTSTAVKPSSSGSSSSAGAGSSNYGWSNPSGQAVKPAQNPSYGWTKPQGSQGSQGSQAIGAAKPAGQQNYGWAAPSNKKPETGFASGSNSKVTNNQFQTHSNVPSKNIGPGGYPVQSGTSYNSGFNTGNNRPNTYNTGFGQSHSNPHYQSGGGYGGYSPQGYSSHHGFSSNNYPSQNHFGYPGQGLYGGSNGPRYGGTGLFGSSGSYGYPGSGSWGSPSYGTGGFKSGGGKTNMLTGLAVGAAGGYLASSLVHRISNPWNYGGHGYGQGYGYDRGYYGRRDYGPTTTAGPPGVESNWINCVAFDPVSNSTMINPNCSCTVTTTVNPYTNETISSHNCTTMNGQIIPPPPPPYYAQPPINYGQPLNSAPPGVNNPDAASLYPGLYQDGQRYGSGPPSQGESLNATSSETTGVNGTNTGQPESMKQTGAYENRKIHEFYSQLEKIVNMGKFL